MINEVIRIRFNLSQRAVGFEGLYQELNQLPDEKAVRLRVIGILHNYSQSLSNQQPFPAATARAQKVMAHPIQNQLQPQSTEVMTTLAKGPVVIDKATAVRAAMKIGGYKFEKNT